VRVNSRHEFDGAAPPQSRSAVTAHLSRNVGGLLYGALIAASSMTVVSVHPPSGGFVGIAALITLGIYWLAHLYTEVLAERISEPGISVWHRTIEAAGHETAILEGGLPVVACYAIVHGFGVNISDSALTALWFTVVILAYIGYRIGRSLQASGIRMIFEVLGTAAFGILMIVLKSVLH
jgi:hypothetical protein